jgi:hypothetical protein
MIFLLCEAQVLNSGHSTADLCRNSDLRRGNSNHMRLATGACSCHWVVSWAVQGFSVGFMQIKQSAARFLSSMAATYVLPRDYPAESLEAIV